MASCGNPTTFEVWIENAQPEKGDWLVRFPSAKSTGDAINDTVALEWYQAKDESGNVLNAPAAVIVHESGSGMTVGRLIAQGLRQRGLHTFMIQLPYYGVRRAGAKPTGERVFAAMRQAIADVRRAKDAVAAITAGRFNSNIAPRYQSGWLRYCDYSWFGPGVSSGSNLFGRW